MLLSFYLGDITSADDDRFVGYRPEPSSPNMSVIQDIFGIGSEAVQGRW
jgi:hypothetical protein